MNTIPVLQLEDIQEDNPMPSRNHSRVQRNIERYLDQTYGAKWEIFPQLSLNLDGWQSIPDLALYERDRIVFDWRTDDEEISIPPPLVIEIVSPKQNLQPLVRKFDQYFEHGVKSCWQIQPMNKTVVLHSLDQNQKAYSEGVLHDPATGIEIPISEIFR